MSNKRLARLFPPIRCPVCRKGMTSYVNLARHMTRTAEMYAQHVEYVERIAGKGFFSFALGAGGMKRLAEILEKGK